MAMIAAYYKSFISLYELRERMGSGRDGTTMFHLQKLGEQLGFDSRCYQLKMEQMDVIPLPAILFWTENHFVVLEKITRKGYVIVDPGIGRLRLSPDEFREKYSGYVLCLTPNNRFERKKAQSTWRPFLKNLWTRPVLFLSILVLSVMLQLFVLGMPILIQFVIDGVIVPKQYDLLEMFFLGIAALLLFQTTFTLIRGKCLINLQNALDHRMMTQFFQHLLRLPYQFFQLRSFGDLLFRANSLRVIRDILSNQLIKGVLDLGLLFVMLLYMLFSSWIMTGWVLLIASINILVIMTTRPRISEANQEEIRKNSLVQGSQAEMLYGIFGVKTAGVEQKMYDRWHEQFLELIRAYRKKENLLNYVNAATGGLALLAPLSILWIGAYQVMAETLTIGGLIAFHSIANQFFQISGSIVQTVNSFILTGSYLRRVQDVLDAPPEKAPENPVRLDSFRGEIELQNVSFAYTKYSPPVIKNVSLRIKPGQKVALVGKSGSGKSTLGRLILGLYQPTEGRVFYDGHDLKDLDLSVLRKQIGVVPQDVTLFNRTIYENITLHNPDAPEQEVFEAAKIAQIHNEIMAMPMKYHTMVSEMGMNISGGQRQRIALARALIHKPSLLLLDEATSSLDHVNEEKIDRLLTKIKCTRIVIAHRLTTVMNADLILVLDNGEVVERGTHEQLMKINGYYRRYYEKFQQNEQAVSAR